jgi:hypothetical protein
MKGMTIADTIGILAVILAVFLFFTQIFPKILDLIVEAFATTSAQAVSSQLAALITVSGVSTYKIEINYNPTKDLTYDVEASGRMLTVHPRYGVGYVKKVSSSSPYAVPLADFKYENVNLFKVIKTFDGVSHYAFSAKKEQ